MRRNLLHLRSQEAAIVNKNDKNKSSTLLFTPVSPLHLCAHLRSRSPLEPKLPFSVGRRRGGALWRTPVKVSPPPLLWNPLPGPLRPREEGISGHPNRFVRSCLLYWMAEAAKHLEMFSVEKTFSSFKIALNLRPSPKRADKMEPTLSKKTFCKNVTVICHTWITQKYC